MAMEADKSIDREFAEEVLGWLEHADGWKDPSGITYDDVPPFTDSGVVLVRGGDEAYLCDIKIPELGSLAKKLSSKRGDVLCRAMLKSIASDSDLGVFF